MDSRFSARLLRRAVGNDGVRLATLLATAVFLLDWATKSWAVDVLGGSTLPLGSLVLGLERNPAFAFSSGSGEISPWLVVGARLLALAGVIVVARRVITRSRRYAAGFALLLGGGAGNAADLLFRGGAVVDFIGAGPFTFGWAGEWIHFALFFNLADVAVLLGLGLIAPQIQTWALAGQRRLAAWEARWLGGPGVGLEGDRPSTIAEP